MTKHDIVNTAIAALEAVPAGLRCTCPQDMLQVEGVHFHDCPTRGWKEHIERVLLSAHTALNEIGQ